MRVTDYELFDVPPRWQFLKVETSDGTVGWGEPYPKWHFIEESTPATRGAVDQLMTKYVLGEDPLRIEDHWQKMYRCGLFRGGTVHLSAVAGIDEALWDIKGKHYGAPVYDLLGGKVRDRVKLYQHVNDAADAREAVDEGFTALKVVPFPEMRRVDTPAKVNDTVQTIAEIRDAIGDDIDLGIDFHGRVSKSMAKWIAEELEPYRPMFIEEPILPDHDDAFAKLEAHTSIPIATGERMYTRWDFKRVFEDNSIDIAQPDLSCAGGITEVRKIASAAETYDIALAPHCPVGPIAFASSVHVDASTPNALVQEQTLFNGTGGLEYLENAAEFQFDDEGYLDVPEGPGLGVEVDESVVRRRSQEEFEWHRPVWRHDDGGVAER
jgi:galactonate dehydratase